MSEIRIGMSGWTYAPWRGRFYPKTLVQKRELEYASRQVNSIEINGTFYSLQKPSSFQSWYDQTPDDFKFAIKAPKFMTHILRLKECREPLSTFLASGLLCLKQKLGPILWQFPPNVTLKDDRFEKFIKLLPHHSHAAAELAKGHSPKINGRSCTNAGGDYSIRHAFEFRHHSFKNPDFLEMLKAHKIAVVLADSGLKSPRFEDLTSDFVYVRMLAETPAYKKGHTESAMKTLAQQILAWTNGKLPKGAAPILTHKPAPTGLGKKDVFAYFVNDEKINAPADALRLMKMLKISPTSADISEAA